jgi:hypothetical protein
MSVALPPQKQDGMKRLMYVVAAVLIAAMSRPHAIEISGTPLSEGNRVILEHSLRRALPPNVELRVVVVDREVATRPAARTR